MRISPLEWKAVWQWLWQMALEWKRMKKGVSGPSTQESLSQIDGLATTYLNDSIYVIVTITYK